MAFLDCSSAELGKHKLLINTNEIIKVEQEDETICVLFLRNGDEERIYSQYHDFCVKLYKVENEGYNYLADVLSEQLYSLKNYIMEDVEIILDKFIKK